MKSLRILALALIVSMLSSSSFSVADGYTITLDVNKIDVQNFDQQYYKINLNDAVSAKNNQKMFSGQPQFYRSRIDCVPEIFANSSSVKGSSRDVT